MERYLNLSVRTEWFLLFVVCAFIVMGGEPVFAQNSDVSLMARLKESEPIVCAHRARISESNPENSLIEMKRSVAVGVTMLEIDLRESADGVTFVIHDGTLDRTTDGSGPISKQSASQLEGHHLKYPDGRTSHEALPRFVDVLKWARTTNVYLMLDLKDAPPEHVMEQVNTAGMSSRVLLLTFDPKTLERARSADPLVLISVLTGKVEDIRKWANSEDSKRLILYVPPSAGTAVLVAADRAGMPVFTDMLDLHDDVAAHVLLDRTESVSHLVNILTTNQPQIVMRTLLKKDAVPAKQ